MKDLNRVVLIGRLTKDVELRYSNSGVCFGHFSVAVKALCSWETKTE